jgi:Na+-driven multidrug efflux pump
VLILVTAVAARQGNAAIAAHQIAFRAWTLLASALDAIAIAGQAITGRYLGAGDVTGARAATNRMIGWGVAYGVMFRIVLVAAIPLLPAVFSAAPDVRRLLPAVLLMAAAQQPVAGVVFAVGATLVIAQHAGLVALWQAFSLWLVTRFVTLTLRARSSQWLVTGAVRR